MASPGNKTVNADIPPAGPAHVCPSRPRRPPDPGLRCPWCARLRAAPTSRSAPPPSRAAPPIEPATPSTRTFTVTVNDTTPEFSAIGEVVAGAAAVAAAGGWAAGAEVRATLHSDPVELGVAVADADGNVSFTFTIPADTPPGEHTIVLSGEGPDGDEVIVSRTDHGAAGVDQHDDDHDPTTTEVTTTPVRRRHRRTRSRRSPRRPQRQPHRWAVQFPEPVRRPSPPRWSRPFRRRP